MAKVSISTIKNWFKTGLKPTQSQFWDWMESYWHKDENIPITAIHNIENILNAKADAEVFTNHLMDDNAHSDLFADKADAQEFENHLDDENAHAVLFAKAKIYPVGELLIFKVSGNPNNALLEIGDYCIGFVEDQFINANYTGGDRTLLSSFGI